MKLLIIGGGGLLGKLVVQKMSKNKNIDLSFPSSLEVDFSFLSPALEAINGIKPDVVLNLAALTDVDYCEKNLQEAYLKNVAIVENLKQAKNKNDFYLIHISTDHLYDSGQKYGTSVEEQVVFKNNYAFTKYAGEIPLLNDQTSVVLRTNFFGKSISGKKSFTDWLYDSAINHQKISLFDDVTFSPLHISTLISTIELILKNRINGIFNCGSRTGLTKAEFAKTFLSKIAPDYKNFEVVNTIVNDNRALRPKHMIMNSSKLEKALNFQFDLTVDEIDKSLKELQ